MVSNHRYKSSTRDTASTTKQSSDNSVVMYTSIQVDTSNMDVLVRKEFHAALRDTSMCLVLTDGTNRDFDEDIIRNYLAIMSRARPKGYQINGARCLHTIEQNLSHV